MARVRLGLALLCALVAFVPSHLARAADAPYPATTVRIIVGFPPGGSVDQMARLYAKELSSSLGGSFIVENRPGASGNIAAALVAKAKPDGYTLLMTSVVHPINVSLYSNLPYDAVKDFAGISPVGYGPNTIAVNPSFPAKSLRELIAYCKAHPGQVAYADAGVGTMLNIGMELFNSLVGIKMIHVPYNGTGPAISAVVGGQVPVLSAGYGSTEPYGKSGKLRILGVATAKRTVLAPEVPTFAEGSGLRGFEAFSWIGLLAPAGTPPAIVGRLNAEIKRLENESSMRDFMIGQGLVPYYLAPGAFDAEIKSDVVKWGKVVRDVGLKAD